MPYPEFFDSLPRLDLPFPEDVVQTRAIRSGAGQVVFFAFPADLTLPMHRHGVQQGTVLEGRIERIIGGGTRTCGPADSCPFPAGVDRRAMIHAGTRAIDVFAQADRHALKV